MLCKKMANFSNGGDSLPWTDSEMIARCVLEAFVEKAVSGDNNDSIMRLAWALVHSHNTLDVQRGITMLEATLAGVEVPMHKRSQILYLMAVGHFRASDYARSRHLIDQALKISPNFQHASTLKKMVMDKIVMDGLVEVGLLKIGLAGVAMFTVASSIFATIIGGRRG